MGLRKPERDAFNAISAATNVDLNNMIFFDDREENVMGARAAGIQAVHVHTPADIRTALNNIGLL